MHACLEHLLRHEQEPEAVDKEPKFRATNGLMKPYVVIKKDCVAIVIDAQIVGERVLLDQAHRAKISKYRLLEEDVNTRYAVAEVVFTSLTLSSRGIWSGRSYEHLTRLGLLKKADAKILSTRPVIGGLHGLNTFHQRLTKKKHSRTSPG